MENISECNYILEFKQESIYVLGFNVIFLNTILIIKNIILRSEAVLWIVTDLRPVLLRPATQYESTKHLANTHWTVCPFHVAKARDSPRINLG